MIRILIIENEFDQAQSLVSQLIELFPEIEILDVCETVEKSLNAIKKHLPDLVFMDVELNNDEKGFDILQKLDKIIFEIIITTSYDKYAIQACKASALDFLKKPIAKHELIAAIEKYKNRKDKSMDSRQIELLLSIYHNSSLALKKFALPTMTGYTFVETENIIYLEGASSQTKVYFSDGKSELVNKTLKDCTDLLFDSNFHRIHKSYSINLNHIKEFKKGRDGSVIMNFWKKELPVSRDFKDEFVRRVAKL